MKTKHSWKWNFEGRRRVDFFLSVLCQLSCQVELSQVKQQAAGWMADFHWNPAAKSKFDEDCLV